MLTLRLHLELTRESHDEAMAVLRALLGPVRAEPGCMATRLCEGAGDSHDVTWVEEWRGTDGFEAHLRGTAFRKILAVIEMASAPPVVEIDEVTSRRGFDLVEEILGSGSVNSTGWRRK
ncbi:MAG TPA: antibiotic biosynthesis monooxygenase family protein [Candidatus Sulfomarinibacteraceae bacterium]|nr:antibiotic biosynthesis monooxygenase family protein [Candidatus Sulfomarinibacteraceae bacterium]